MLGRANDELAGRQQYRAEQARIASLDTIQAIETERKAVQAAADEQVKAGKFVAADKEAYYQKMDVLQVKQMALEKDQANKRAEFHKAEKERFIDEEKMLADRYQQVYDIEIKRRKLKSEQQTALVDTGKKEDFNTQMDVVKDTHAGEKEVAEARLKAQGATELQIKQQLTEMDRKFSADLHAVRMQNIVDESRSRVAEIQKERQEIERAGGDALERDKRLTKLKGDEDKLLFDLRKKGIEETGRFDREQNKLTNDLKIAGIQAQLKAEEERINKTKAMADAVAQKFDAKQFGQQQDPQKVFEQFQRDRMLKAQQEQVARDQDLWTKGQNVGMPGQKAAQDKFWSNQKAAMQKAKNQAARDAENGNFSDGELQKAQVNVGKEVVNNAGKQGQINANTVKALNDVLTGLANTADAQDNVQATLDRLVAAAKGQKQVAKRQAENARNQANSLE